MVYTPVGPWTDGAAPALSAANLTKIEAGITAPNAHLIAGPGIDLTGVTPSTTAVQAFLDGLSDGSIATVPNGAIINLDSGLNINKRIRLTGPGELRWTACPGRLINVNVDGVHLDGIYMTNPNGIQQRGVYVQANIFRATGCRLVGMQDGILIAATGEFHDIVIANNLILDVIGQGLGSGDTSSAGESGGDGIVVWGATATITGNRITCKAGKDCRIGIHMEALAPSEVTPYPNADSMGAIVGNVITGQFRRGIVAEGVAHVTITGNAIADSTFWGIAIISAHFNTVTGNTIKWTRTALDTQGAGQSPTRSGMMLYAVGSTLNSTIVANNIIYAVSGSSIQNGIYVAADSGVASNGFLGVKIVNNQIVDDSGGSMSYGINFTSASTGTEIRDNRIPTFRTVGIHLLQAANVTVNGNKMTGQGTGSGTYGIFLEGGAADAQVNGNRVENANTAISTQFRSGLLAINSNSIRNATTGIDMFSSGTAVGTAAINSYTGVTSKAINGPAGVITTGANG